MVRLRRSFNPLIVFLLLIVAAAQYFTHLFPYSEAFAESDAGVVSSASSTVGPVDLGGFVPASEEKPPAGKFLFGPGTGSFHFGYKKKTTHPFIVNSLTLSSVSGIYGRGAASEQMVEVLNSVVVADA